MTDLGIQYAIVIMMLKKPRKVGKSFRGVEKL